MTKIPTVYEAIQISVHVDKLDYKVEELTRKLDKFMNDNATIRDDIRECIENIQTQMAKIETKIENIEEKLKIMNGIVKDVPLLNQWKASHQKKCDDIQSGHKKRHEDIMKDIDNDIKNFEKLLDQRFSMQDKALVVSTKNTETRFEKLNELRNDVIQDRSRYVTYDKFDAQQRMLEERIKTIEMWQSKMIGIAIGLSLIAGISGGVITKIF